MENNHIVSEMATVKEIHQVKCPRCKAEPGTRCTVKLGVASSFHNERAQEANRINADIVRAGKKTLGITEGREVKVGSKIRYGVETSRKIRGNRVVISRNATVKHVDDGKIVTHNGIELAHDKKVESRSNIERHLDWHVIKEETITEIGDTAAGQRKLHAYSAKAKKDAGWNADVSGMHKKLAADGRKESADSSARAAKKAMTRITGAARAAARIKENEDVDRETIPEDTSSNAKAFMKYRNSKTPKSNDDLVKDFKSKGGAVTRGATEPMDNSLRYKKAVKAATVNSAALKNPEGVATATKARVKKSLDSQISKHGYAKSTKRADALGVRPSMHEDRIDELSKNKVNDYIAKATDHARRADKMYKWHKGEADRKSAGKIYGEIKKHKARMDDLHKKITNRNDGVLMAASKLAATSKVRAVQKEEAEVAEARTVRTDSEGGYKSVEANKNVKKKSNSWARQHFAKRRVFEQENPLFEALKKGYHLWDTADGTHYPEGGVHATHAAAARAVRKNDFAEDNKPNDNSLAVGYSDGQHFHACDSKGNLGKRLSKESVELEGLSIDEISDHKLGQYIDASKKQGAMGYGHDGRGKSEAENNRAFKRTKGISKAQDKIDDRTPLGREPKVHDVRHMKHDGDVYDHTQTHEHIKDGDVLHMHGNRSAIMFKAWPTMIHGKSDALHTFTAKGHPPRYDASVAKAKAAVGVKEDVELDEISNVKIGSYVSKASKQLFHAAQLSDGGKKKDMQKIALKRQAGIERAGRAVMNKEEVEQVDEALKLLKTHSEGSKTAKVYRDADWEEYRVKHYTDGKHHTKADYHTNDKDDAHDTAKHWVNKKEAEVHEGKTWKASADGGYANKKELRTKIKKFARDRKEGTSKRQVQEDITETRMPSGVIKHKQRLDAMSDVDFAKAHGHKSEDELKSMAWRLGYGKGSSHFVNRAKKGSETVKEDLYPEVRSLNKKKDPVSLEPGSNPPASGRYSRAQKVQMMNADGISA